jgi:nicotinamide riboside kinase
MLADWEDDDTRICSSEEQHDEKYQRLIRNLRGHEIALIIIRQKNLDEAESQSAYLRVLEKAYIFLIKFVRNNREN